MILSEPPATVSSAAPRRTRAVLLAAAAISLALAIFAAAGAPARATSARHDTCAAATTRHAKREKRTGSRCTRRSPRRGSSRQPAKHGRGGKKGSGKGAPAKKRTPALCEDGSVPLRGPEGFTCADGSEPSCQGAGEPVAAPDGQPVCEAAEADAGECTAGAGECEAAAGGCEAGAGDGESGPGCESTPEVEVEVSAGDEAERAQPTVLWSATRPWGS